MNTRIRVVVLALAALFAAACGGPSDADLKAAAETALKGDPAMSGVTVEVTDGVATIGGEVADDAARAKAAELASVDGVRAVTNDVKVAAPPPPQASADDETLKTKVEEALKAKACGDIQVEVMDGVVTLSGSIAQTKLGECTMAALETKPGKFVNQLQVVN